MKKTIFVVILAIILIMLASCQNKMDGMTETDLKNETAETNASLTVQQPTEKPTAAPEASKTSETIETLQNNAEKVGSSISTKELNQTFSLLNDRLYVSMPDGTQDMQMQKGVMYAPESNQRVTRLMLEDGKKKLVLYVQETFNFSSGSIEKDMEDFAESWFGEYSGKISTSIHKTNDGLEIIKLTPNSGIKYDDSMLIDSAFIKTIDDTIIYAGVYVTYELFNDENLCKEQAAKIINSIHFGEREVGKSKIESTLSNQFKISIDEGYALIEQKGIDFDVYYIKELTKIDESGNSIGIYLGWHPGTNVDKIKEGHEGYEFVKEKILGKEVLFVGEKEGTEGHYWQALIHPNDTILAMHIFFSTSNDEELDEAVEILKTLEFTD